MASVRLQSIVSALTSEQLPAVFVDLDAFDRNAKSLALWARQSQLTAKTVRIATKSIRVPALIKRVLASDPIFQGVMCFSMDEASSLVREGVSDILVAYPVGQVSEIELWSESSTDAMIRGVVDQIAHLEQLQSVFERRHMTKPFEVVVDLDLSVSWGPLWLGVRRSPVRSLEDLRNFLEASKNFRGVRVVGVMGYEAQVAGLGDRNPFKRAMNPLFRMVRRVSRKRIRIKRSGVPRVFELCGMKLEIFNGGGTGSFNWANQEPSLTELTAGSALFCSHLFDAYSNINFEAASYFALPVCRTSPGHVTCLGGGYIASGEPGWDRVPVPVWPEGLSLVASEGCGEVQTPLRGPAVRDLSWGDAVVFRSAKAGEIMERFDTVHLVKDSAVVESPKTYRGMGWCFF